MLLDTGPRPPDLVLLASGSEVHLALDAAGLLRSDHNVAARVVSIPSWELFEQQDDLYRSSVLPSDVPIRLAVEAASPFGWQWWVGDRGGVVGIDGFGASAPGAIVMENYGFTATKVAARALELLTRSGGDRPKRAPRRKVDGHT